MSRPEKRKEKIDGKTYGTAKYYAEIAHVSPQTARRHLKESEISGLGRNPELYPIDELRALSQNYEQKKATSKKYIQYIKDVDEQRQKMLQNFSQHSKIEEERDYTQEEINLAVKNQSKTVERLLRAILYNQGFTFDDEELTEDITKLAINNLNYEDLTASQFNENKVIEKRLNKPNSYLKPIKKD
ncbi:hypothetical protein G6R29_06065 [Fructobacillus sp. M2-14]|uniref:Uncharacterized protein n=1 Tax=Fructobacillus broussonetiae TaxID=2713173 RepID=A0ABS5R164_9LACO|nr:hypothetical protein [Fructobacillus broussonetiae]MBS9339183.1 hypothetical protein [Fructobacillus broussonetiae]